MLFIGNLIEDNETTYYWNGYALINCSNLTTQNIYGPLGTLAKIYLFLKSQEKKVPATL